MSLFNPAVAALETPAIPLALSWITDYTQTRGPVIDLSQAVPNYPPPPEVLQSLSRYAGSTESTGYGNIEGEPLLRRRYAEHVGHFYQCSVLPAQVHITSGCNQAFVATLLALAAPGDRILMTNPCYFNHEATASMLGLDIGYVQCTAAQSFVPDIELLEQHLAEGVRVLALVSPNNPTGAVYPADLLLQIYALCKKFNTWLILDETYRDFISSDELTHDLLGQPDWENTLIQLYSFSKALCIPGHRIGAMVAGTAVINNVAKVMDNLQICAPRAAQLTVAEQLPLLEEWRLNNQREITDRAAVFKQVMSSFPDWKITSIGAYFAYVRHPFRESSLQVAKRMAQDFGVLPLPGEFFGQHQENYLRIAFANADVATLQRLPARLDAMCEPVVT